MKILFSPDDDLIKKDDFSLWGVDIVVIPNELSDYTLPEAVNEFTLFIPTIINQDFALNYDGAEFALRMCFQILRRKIIPKFKLVLLGIENAISFMKKYSYPKILNCPGFDYLLFNREYIKNYRKTPEQFNRDTLLFYIKDLGLKLPESYRSNHSFVNEWCFYKWSNYMGFNNAEVLELLHHNIYFDYLRTIDNKTTKKASSSVFDRIHNLKGKILLIDDSHYWHNFFAFLFGNNEDNKQFQFDSIGTDFSKKPIKDIIKLCEKKILEFNPDLILLDFRLNEDIDFDVKNAKDISGARVLGYLKGSLDEEGKYNENGHEIGIALGTRIILFTATGKIEFVQTLHNLEADGFIFKERPEIYVGKSSTKDNIRKMLTIFDDMLTCAPIAKTILEYFNRWTECISELSSSNEVSLKVNHVIKVVRTFMVGDFLDMSKLKLIYLECFGILENLKEGKEDIYPFIDRLASKLRLDSKRYGLWQDINYLRTSLAHGDSMVKFTFCRQETEITNTIISEWLINLCNFIFGILNLYVKNLNK